MPCKVPRMQRKSLIKLAIQKKFTSPSGKLRTNFTSPIAKSTSPGISDTTFFAQLVPSNFRFYPQPKINLRIHYIAIIDFGSKCHMINLHWIFFVLIIVAYKNSNRIFYVYCALPCGVFQCLLQLNQLLKVVLMFFFFPH